MANPAMPPAAQKKWAILAGIPNVVATDEEDAKDGVRRRPVRNTISVAHAEPPNASVLTVPSRVTSAPTTLWHPYVAAADPSGLILLCATQPLTTFSCVVNYHLCDAATGKVAGVPRHFLPTGLLGDNVGLLRRGRDFMVAELRPAHDGTGRAALLRFTAGKYKWAEEKELAYAPPLDDGRRFFGEGVVAHARMLWWVDLSYGILACDPFADEPELIHVPLPRVADELPAAPVGRGVYRCVKVSDGRLRHVQIHGSSAAPVVTVSALADPAAAGDWVPERSVALAEIWDDQSYLDTMLPQSIPALAFIHPLNPNKVYFFISSSIFAVNLRLRKVVEFSEFWMPKPPPHLKPSSHFVHVWLNDPSCRPDVLPSCFRRDEFSVDFKLQKRFAAAQRRWTAANKPVPIAATESRLTSANPTTHDNGTRSKTIRDHESMEMEELQAKKMKLKAIFSEVIECAKIINFPQQMMEARRRDECS